MDAASHQPTHLKQFLITEEPKVDQNVPWRSVIFKDEHDLSGNFDFKLKMSQCQAHIAFFREPCCLHTQGTSTRCGADTAL